MRRLRRHDRRLHATQRDEHLALTEFLDVSPLEHLDASCRYVDIVVRDIVVLSSYQRERVVRSLGTGSSRTRV